MNKITPIVTHLPAAVGAALDAAQDFPRPAAPAPASTYHFQAVFKTTQQMKSEFSNFLRTIFYQLDERKVFALMDEICQEGKPDAEVYQDLLKRIDDTKKTGSIFHKVWSLFVVQKGMAKQTNTLMQKYRKEGFQNYMEIYDRRYLTTIRKVSGLPLNGQTIALTDADGTQINLRNRLEAWAIHFPYNTHVKLSEKSDLNPLDHPEITYPPLGDEIKDNSMDLVVCIGGLHHTPPDRLEPFLDSLHQKVSPGGMVLLREHDLSQSKNNVFAMAYVVHSFVNAADGVPLAIEQKEVREFKPVPEWDGIMNRHGFTKVSDKGLILEDDPTQNALSAYMKMPRNKEEFTLACQKQEIERTQADQNATWIEWGNVRFSDDYAYFVQNHHSYAFDFTGHLKQHWTHFYHFLRDTECSNTDLILSGGMAMNLFILFTATLSCSSSAVTSIPGKCLAKLKHGENWRESHDLSGLERYQAKVDKEYADFIHHTPFYSFPYLSKIGGLWKSIYQSDDSALTKFTSTFSALGQSVGYLVSAAGSAPIRAFYTSDAFVEPETVKVVVHDPENKVLESVNGKAVKTLLGTPDGYKLVAVPRYKDFLAFCKELPKECKMMQVCGQDSLSVDTWGEIPDERELYQVKELNVPAPRILRTYLIAVPKLAFLDFSKVEHVHE